MIGTVTAPLSRRIRLELPWWQIGLYAVANLPLIVVGIGGIGIDWSLFADAPTAYIRGDLYAPSDVRFVWSPIAALLLTPFVPFGYVGWVLLHLVVVALLASPTLILLVALSGGFWADLAFGNTVTFVFVAGVLALRGNRGSALVFVALCALMPRAIQFPLLAWLLWQQPWLRLPTLAIVVVHACLVISTGYGPAWITAMLELGPQQMAPAINWGPTALVGITWLAAGIPLAALLTRYGYVGLAGLAMSPYILPHYALMILWDLRSAAPPHETRSGRPADNKRLEQGQCRG